MTASLDNTLIHSNSVQSTATECYCSFIPQT